jgi:hypothetical protein
LIKTCEVEPVIEKMNFSGLQEAVDEVIALSGEYFKICGQSEKIEICAYFNMRLNLEKCRITLLGLTLLIPTSTLVDDLVLKLLKYTHVITRIKDTVVFHVSKNYSLGVYYLVSRDKGVKWGKAMVVERDEVVFFLEE